MGTNYVRYVDVDADAGGDGTTSALTGANCAFKSLSLAEAGGGGVPSNLTTNGDTYTIICRSAHANHTADSTYVAISGWTTSATSYITITVDDGHHHVGAWDATKYRLEGSRATLALLENSQKYTRISKLQVHNTDSSAGASCVGDSGGSQSGILYLDRVLAKTLSNSYANYTFIFSNADATVTNCIAINRSTHATVGAGFLFNAAKTYNVSHCTSGGTSKYGFWRTSGTVAIKNSYAGTTHASGVCFSGTITQTTNASSDTTAGGTAGDSIAYTTANFANVTGGSEDLRLVSGSALIGIGTDVSGDTAPLNCPTCIAGNARPQNTTWDIGAHEYYVASGPANVSTIDGLAKASVATVDGLAMASVASINGLT